MKKAFKKLTSFEFWQKFGKCLMVVIAVMPAAGLMVSIGNSIPLINADSAVLATVGNVIAQIGWGIINNLHILFALAIGGSWAKERAGGAFAAGIAFILINLITGHIYGVSLDMIADSKSVVHNVFGGKMLVSDYFVNVLGQPALNMGVFVGIIAGFVGGMLANQGGSGFLGALIAGFVAGYLVLGIKKLVSGLPDSLEGTKPVLFYPVLGVLFIGIAITFIINPPVSALNNWLMESLQTMGTSSRVLLGLIFGAMMSVDMGGPVNKAAYVIGTGALATGEYGIMASVMAGGMVPPLAIALCTTLFPNRFSEAERKSGPTNYIMGLSFITEGAIPFAAADPIRVLPSCIIGAGTAGALSMFFECTLRAPHGGIFVVPTIGNPLMYLVSIAIGAVIGCALLAILKNPVKA